MTKRIFDCNLFNDYVGKEYKIKTTHRIFGKNEMRASIHGFIDDEERIGIIIHGKNIYCYKNDGKYKFTEESDRVIISDLLMEISILG